MADDYVTGGPMVLVDAISALAGIVLGDQSFDNVLGRLAHVTKRTVPGAYEVSVTMHERRPVTAASTAEFAQSVDDCQYEAGDGPCLEALRTGETVLVRDQKTEERWPEYSRQATRIGVQSSLSVPLLVEDKHVAALNIYGETVDAFDSEATAAAEQLAVYAGVTLNNADLYFTASSRAEQMRDAMGSRAVIEQAKGVLMAGRRCDADEAFGILVKLSQHSHRKLRDVAQAIIDEIATS